MKELGERQAEQGRAAAVRRQAVRFIVLLGVVSLFSDMVYEGARSATGPFLLSLGASAGVVGTVAGLGELLGYALRLVSGDVADRTRRYWLLTGIGYAVNLLSVPLLALAGRWDVAAGLVLIERIGKGIRTPSRDVLLSYATREVGRGFGFGLHEALDQIGAILGPLVVAGAAFAGEGYRTGFAWLLAPAILALGTLAAARLIYASPQRFEATGQGEGSDPSAGAAAAAARGTGTDTGAAGGAAPRPEYLWGLGRGLWLYIAFSGLTVFGFAHFQLLSYHFKAVGLMSDALIPLAFAIAMGVDAVAALIVGRAYDRSGLNVLLALPVGTLLASVLAFGSRPGLAWAGLLVWGVVMGVQETIMRAAIADLSPLAMRGRAYGVFNTVFGIAWFVGSAIMGFLYDVSVTAVIVFAVAVQLLALPVFAVLHRTGSARRAAG